MQEKNRQVIVVGAGLTGLTCAWQLKKRGADVAVLEASNHIGGQMQTIKADGFIMEEGPSTGTIKHPEVAELFEDLNEYCTLEVAQAANKRRYIWKGKQFHSLPSGPVGGLFTPLFTLKDKFRILGEPWCKKGTDPNESVGSLAARRLGRSFVDYAVDPFLGGVYAGDPYRLPVRLALPKLYNLEQNYGSFIRGAMALSKQPKTPRQQKATKEVISAEGGFCNLTSALEKAIGADRIVLQCQSLSIRPLENGMWEARWEGGSMIARHVVTACPAYSLPDLLPFLSEDARQTLGSLYYAPVIEIGVGIKDTGNVHWNCFGGLIPSKEHKQVLGILMPSACFKHRAPEGGATYAYFIGGARHPEYLDKSDDELKAIVNESLHTMLGYPEGKKADVIRIFRHSRAIPQYMEDMDERLKCIEQVEHVYPSLHIGGNIYGGIGMGDRIKQAVDIANAIAL